MHIIQNMLITWHPYRNIPITVNHVNQNMDLILKMKCIKTWSVI